MHFKDLGLHDYTLKNLMYENNCCKFYDAVDENNTSYVLKFVPSDVTSEGDTFPFVDRFQVKEGVFWYIPQMTLEKKVRTTLLILVVVEMRFTSRAPLQKQE